MRQLLRLSAIVVLVAACDSGVRRVADSTTAMKAPAAAVSVPMSAPAVVSTPALPSASAAVTDPAAAFTRYLAYSVFRGAPPGDDSLSGCPPIVLGENDVDEGWEPDNYFGFVRPRVLDTSVDSADTTGTLATGRAELVRVAEIGRDAGGWVGTMERRVDTLTFSIQRGPTGWTVCGPATKVGADSRVGEMTFNVNYASTLQLDGTPTRWLPEGTSPDDVAKHVDSVTAHLP